MKEEPMSIHARTLTVAASVTMCAVAMLPGSAAGSTGLAPSTAAGSAPRLVVFDLAVDNFAPALSWSGRYVAHLAIRRGQSPAVQRVQRTDLTSGRSTMLNPSVADGVAAGNYSRPPVISFDGTRVAYSTDGDDLVAGDDNATFDAFVRDVPARRTLLASEAAGGGVANGDVGMVSMSRNGRYAVFTSDATDEVPGSTTINTDVYRRDLRTGATVQVSVRPNGSPSRGPGSLSTDVSANGNRVAFTSYDFDLARDDGDDGEPDLYVRTMSTGRTRWLSPSFPTGANPGGVVMSPDGRWISTRWSDGSLHLTNTATRATTLVAASGYALLGSMSSRRDRLVYISAGAPYVRDLDSGATTPIPFPAGGTVSSVTISGNGGYAAYDWFPADGSAARIYRVAL
jgi:hypothetical protein